MEDNLSFVILNKYNKNNMVEAYRIIFKKNLLSSRIVLSLFPSFGIVSGIYMKINSNSSIFLIAAIFISIIFSYLLFNLEKLQLTTLNKKFNLSDNLPDKFSFYNSYYLFEKNHVGTSTLGKLSYDQIDTVYISDHLFILKFTSNPSFSIINKDGFEVGTSDEFLMFLEDKFKGKIKTS
ncbi:MAG: hypothetical protein RR891_00675 [Clostridium sp.]|uniref:hypothetical protein n=1 Tax=Clostridium sp. TaxID=1506 RepID=UPI0030479EA5